MCWGAIGSRPRVYDDAVSALDLHGAFGAPQVAAVGVRFGFRFSFRLSARDVVVVFARGRRVRCGPCSFLVEAPRDVGGLVRCVCKPPHAQTKTASAATYDGRRRRR